MTEEPLRVLHVIAHMEKGGAERQMCLLTEASRHHHCIAVLAGNERVSESPVELLPDLRFGKTVTRIRRILRDRKIDVLHTWVPERLTVPATLAAWLEGCPVLAGDRRKPRNYGISAARDRLYYLPYLLADQIVPNYPILPKPLSLARFLGFRRKTTVIPNGIVQRGTPDPLSAVPDRILFVGRLVEQKRVSHLIRALPELFDQAGVGGLDIVGDGPDRAMLEALARDTGMNAHVTFHGALFDWHERFDPSRNIVALPSASEGMSNTVFEAIDHGFPPLVSDSSEIRALFEGANAEPWYFPLEDDQALVRAVRDLRGLKLSDLQQKIDTLRVSLTRYSLAEMVAQYDALYARLASGSGPR